MAQSHREASRRLFEIAERQQGFFTTEQARAAGFAENTHPYHVQVGNWIREHRGICRLALTWELLRVPFRFRTGTQSGDLNTLTQLLASNVGIATDGSRKAGRR